MANTYYQMYVQSVFAVKYRESVIAKAWQSALFAVIGNLINETGCKTIIVNGVEDHVHCLFGLKPSVAVSEVMKNAKAKSSKWLNESGLLEGRFEWQEGFGAFTYSSPDIDRVFRYILNQEEHHKNQTFRQEYLELLAHFKVEFNTKYVFEDLL